MRSVYISGLGIVSALGLNAKNHYTQLSGGRIGIGHYQDFGQYLFAGKVGFSNQQLSKLAGIPFSPYNSRTALLGLVAAKEAWGDQTKDSKLASAFVNGSTVGGMDLSERYFEALATNEIPDPQVFQMHDLGAVSEFIAKNLGGFEYVQTISTACSSSANAILHGAELIRSGDFDRVLVGGTDALCKFTVEGFKSLMIYDYQSCQPFDQNRRGLNLGEGAAYLLLESEKAMEQSGKSKLAEVRGWANCNDAFHQTGTSPEGLGAQKAMIGSLESAGLNPKQIDYINAHGTGTATNDSSELSAMEAVFQNEIPDFSSTKGSTGHTLAACGAMEAVFSIFSILENRAYGTPGIQEPMTSLDALLRKSKSKKISNVMSNSFGFGGNSTSLIFSEIV